MCEEFERLDANGIQVRLRGSGLHFTSQVSLAADPRAATNVKRLAAPLHHHFLEHPDEVEWMLAQRPA